MQIDGLSSYSLIPRPSFEREESAVSGGSIDGGGGGKVDDGSGSGGGDDGDEEAVESLLKTTNRTLEDLPEAVRGLEAANMRAYLEATSNPISAFLAKVWPGWLLRCAADAEFPFKVLMELTVGLSLSSSGMIAARGKDLWKELDFAICDITVGAVVNFLLVYLLTPTYTAPGAKLSAVARLPANVFIAGNYTIPARVASLLYKGALFGVCGFFAGLAGTGSAQGLMQLRKTLRPEGEVSVSAASKDMPGIIPSALGWAGYMALSSNPRYQIVAGVERGLFRFAPDSIAKAGSALLRTGNNVVGGASWVWWARAIGLQKRSVDNVLSNGPEI